MRYNADSLEEVPIHELAELPSPDDGDKVSWIDIQGLGDEPTLRTVANRFNIHPLALEDIVHTPQRPKSEEYTHHHLIITRMVRLEGRFELDVEQVAIVVTARCVLTFQQRYGDVLDPVRKRIREGSGHIRKRGADYLAYAILDTIVDGYFPILEDVSMALESLEDTVMKTPTKEVLSEINASRALLIALRRGIWPQRAALTTLARDPNPFIQEETRLYLRDTFDHATQLVEVLESLREVTGGLFNTYVSVLSLRMNEIMKVLTVTASIFIPLTFLAGIYGMNFEFMPELQLRWAYPALWAVMLVLGLGLLVFFRRKGWIGSARPDDG